MPDLTIRPVTRADAAAVNDLMAAAEAVDRTGEHYNVDDVLEDLANPMIDLDRDWVVVEREGQVVAHARLLPRAPVESAVSVSLDGVVHPQHRRSGIGSQVVPLMLARAHEYARERDLQALITAQALSEDTDLAAILQREGLESHRWSFVMEADLAAGEPTAPEPPPGFALSTWTGADHDELRQAHNIAFVGHPGFTPWDTQMWDQSVARSRNTRPELSLLLRDPDGAVAAYLQTNEYDAVEQATGIKDAFVAKVGTLPDHRRQGLAGTLLRIALQRYRAEGFSRSSLDVDSQNPTGALGLYQRAGFATTVRWTSYRAP